QVITPCLPLLLRSEMASAIDYGVDQSQMSAVAVVSEKHFRLGQAIWDALWPSITADHEAKIAVQEVAKTPKSPTWQSTLEQGLITILKKDADLAQNLARLLEMH
ncbi:MAG: hypothetical protein AAF152_07205, partial [Cyanobacteria bacterium P01_A01_bin.114]